MAYLNEDTLVQQTTADYLHDHLGWDTAYAYNQENFGPEELLGRNSDREVVLTRHLRQALKKLNPNLPETAYDEAVRQVKDYSQSQSMLANNFDKYKLFKDGVLVSFQGEHGEIKKERLKIFNFDDAAKNDFLAVRELWVQGDLYRRRIDIAGFVNGIPLLFVECKNIHKDLKPLFFYLSVFALKRNKRAVFEQSVFIKIIGKQGLALGIILHLTHSFVISSLRKIGIKLFERLPQIAREYNLPVRISA